MNKYASQQRYAQKNKRSFTIDCMKSTEIDIINKLEDMPNYARYIKNLIRADIERCNEETETLLSIPSMKESINEGLNTPIEECVELDIE